MTNMTKQRQNRNATIDFAKGFTILLMLYMHIAPEQDWISSFHMPLFFILSGYFFREESLHITLKKKAKGLLWPYLWMSFLMMAAYVIKDLYWKRTLSQISLHVKILLEDILLGRLWGLVWFLMALFVGTMVYALLWRLGKKHLWLYLVLIAGCSVVGYWLRNRFYYPTLPSYQYDVALFVIPWIALGHQVRRLREGEISWWKVPLSDGKRAVLFVLAVLLWVLGRPEAPLNLALRVYANYPYLLVRAAAATYCIVFLSRFAARIPLLGSWICWQGRHTLPILCMGNIARLVLDWSTLCHTENIWMQFALQVLLINIVLLLWGAIATRGRENLNGVRKGKLIPRMGFCAAILTFCIGACSISAVSGTVTAASSENDVADTYSKAPVTWLALGDSMTAGADEDGNGYTEYVCQDLPEVTCYKKGIPGYGIIDLYEHREKMLLDVRGKQIDVITVFAGTNDFGAGVS
jgi:hypothetical protein